MKYHYLRLFLLEIDQSGDLFDAPPARLDRSAYLRLAFSQRIDFEHRNNPLVFQPIGEQEVTGGAVSLGRIGRRKIETVNKPPEENFEEEEAISWRAANVLIDTRSDSEGQKVAMQFHIDVGRPLPVFVSLVNFINEVNSKHGWQIEVNVMTSTTSFWEAVNKNKGSITYVEFDFVTPNVLQLRNQLNEGLKEARQKRNAQKVRVGLQNKNGLLDLDGQEVIDAVEYVSEGGGSVKLKSGQKKIYDSEEEERAEEVEDDEPLIAGKRSTWQRISDILF
ncbi:MAG: hypothetical protein VYD87_17235 [Pseudomonadota bacterium]|nr:hypothetical protein [Pseudomonadota bacterium]